MTRAGHDSLVTPVLATIDRTLLIGVPAIVATAVIAFPTYRTVGLKLLGLLLVAAWGMAVLGQLGRAPWRSVLYPLIVLAIAVIGLWTQGPTAGVGAAMGLAVLLASALWPRVGVWVVVVGATGAVTLRASGVASTLLGDGESIVFERIPIWLRLAFTVGVISWIATRVLRALISSLELAYQRAADAYRLETATRAELASSRHELDEAEHIELVGRLAGGVAHDVNNALTAILAASDVLGDKLTTAAQRTQLNELEAASRQAAELVRDLLWIGRKFPPTTTTADVQTTVSECLRRLERMGRKVELHVAVTDLCVALAPERLEQVLFRVVLLAQRSGVTDLSLRGSRVDAMIELELRGTDGNVARTSSSMLRPKGVSARLGMSAAKEAIEQAGGSLIIEDVDGQLSVRISLPAGKDERPAVLPPIGRARTALVVDDEPLVLGRLAKLVGRRGYTVMSASSLAEAWPMLALEPDLLVTDLQLGDGRGEDLVIASYARAPERPIVVCSGFGADDALEAQLKDARLRFLPKPFTMAELEAAIPRAEGDS